MESGGWRVEGGGWRVEGGGWRVESGEWRVEGGGWRVESGERLVGCIPGCEDGDVVALARQFAAQRGHEIAAEVAGEAGVVVGEDG